MIDRHMAAVLPSEDRPELCSCGCTEPHEIARRTTADGKVVCVWSDGDITLPMGVALRGYGRPRSKWALRSRIRAVRLLMDDFELFESAEIPALIKIAAKTYAHTYSSEIDRARHAIALFRKAGTCGTTPEGETC